MSDATVQYWSNFWSGKTSPLHREGTTDYLDKLAAELILILPSEGVRTVLEIGCGNGDLFRRLQFDTKKYFGIDLSESLLSQFRSSFPGVEVGRRSGHDFRADRQFDLIFSHGVIQYFSPSMLDEHLGHARTMLADGGMIVHAGIPWKRARRDYRHQLLLSPARNSRRIKMLVAGALERLGLRRDTMGYWYELSTLHRMAERHRLMVSFAGSINYPYRFHALMAAA